MPEVVLDEDESVAIGLSRFSERVRAFGYVGDLKELFQAFQPDVHSVLTMKEWDARSHTLVTAFRSALLEKYGTVIEGWKKGLDPEKVGSLDKDRFVQKLSELGLGDSIGAKGRETQSEVGGARPRVGEGAGIDTSEAYAQSRQAARDERSGQLIVQCCEKEVFLHASLAKHRLKHEGPIHGEL